MANMDYVKVSELLEDFFQLTRIRISFWDINGNKRAAGPMAGDSEFCSILRSRAGFDAQCKACDRAAIQQAASQPDRLHCFRCPAGLNEYIYPALYDNILLGFFMFGQVRHVDTDNMSVGAELRRGVYCANGLDVEAMERKYEDLPPVTTAIMASAGRMLSALANYAYLNGLVKLQQMPIAERIQRYIKEHYTENISIESACQSLYISRSTLSHTLKNAYNDTFVNMVNRYRIQHVKQNLHKGMSITDACFQAGFQSENYLSRVFRKYEGITPQQYKYRREEI